MAKAQYAILRFSKYKGPEISRIEAHNERTKEKYASNPDVDTSRSTLNFHLIQPEHSYREEAERQIAEAGCRVRSDSVKLVEVLIAGTPSFFKDKTQEQIKEYFEHALEFLRQKQRAETFVSAVVHLDEKTPHMHVTFVPLTDDNRLSAKKIIGNKARLSQWQSDYWTHMVGKYPDLERGESADKTARKHIPPRVFKEMTHLAKQSRKIEAVMDDANVFNAKSKLQEVEALLERFIPSVERMQTQLDQYKVAFTDTTTENASLKKEIAELQSKLDTAKRGSVQKKLDDAQLLNDYRELRRIVERIPPENLERAKRQERSAPRRGARDEDGERMARKKKIINNTPYPQHVIDAVARCLWPDIVAFFESEEGQKEFEAWKRQQDKERVEQENQLKAA